MVVFVDMAAGPLCHILDKLSVRLGSADLAHLDVIRSLSQCWASSDCAAEP